MSRVGRRRARFFGSWARLHDACFGSRARFGNRAPFSNWARFGNWARFSNWAPFSNWARWGVVCCLVAGCTYDYSQFVVTEDGPYEGSATSAEAHTTASESSDAGAQPSDSGAQPTR